MNIVLFEDSKTDRLYPLHFTRHVSEFLCGRFTLKERMERLYPGEKIFFWGREYLKGYFLEKYPGLRYNSFTEGETLFLNARFIPLERITPRNEETGTADGETAYFFLRKPAIKNLSPDGLLRGSGFSGGLKKKNANGYFVRHLWDFNKINGELIRSDFPGKRGSVPRGASLPGDQACFGKGVRVSPLSVIDTA
ncbi:MAG TPA: putative sugar nucleotidyl transferase, partial [bacterium]|nr:putative sugar nucleotidyl transferase [bacterium]